MPDLLSTAAIEYLTGRELRYDAELEGGMIALIVYDYELPAGYQPHQVDLLLRLPLQFPDAAPDMFWTSPVVTYTNNGALPPQTDQRESHRGRTWQRWSRHFTETSRWRPGVDDLRSYMTLIGTTLKNEVVPLAA